MDELSACRRILLSLLVVITVVSLSASAMSNEMLLSLAGQVGDTATFQVALGDLDGDGDLDAVFANMSIESQIWMNDGSGQFTNSGHYLGSYAHGVAIGDIDGDDDLDLVFAQASTSFSSQVYLNNGSGRFMTSRHNLGDRASAANAISLFDADGDGDLDAGVYYADHTSIVYFNTGSGVLEPRDSVVPGLAIWGDVDGDGDIDAVCLRAEGGYSVHRNRGDGIFDEAGIVEAPSELLPGSAALGDIDNDGDLDILCSSGDFEQTTPLTVLLNDGAGTFSYEPSPTFFVRLSRTTLGDFNGDNFIDIFLGAFDRPNALGLNDRTGHFIDASTVLGNHEMEGISAVGDLDGDSRLDLFVAVYGEGGPNLVYLNHGG